MNKNDQTFDERLDEILDNYTTARMYSTVENRIHEKRAAIQAIKEAVCKEGCNTIQKIKIIPNSAMFLVREFYIEVPCIHCGKEK